MANLAAVITAAKTPIKVQEVEIGKPGPHELLVKNEVIAFNPVEFKIARLAIFPIQYPAILGSSFGGTVEAVGSQVSSFRVGDKVAASKNFSAVGTQYGAYQRYTVVGEDTTSKVPEGIDVAIPTSLLGNLPTIVALFTGRAGLDKPSFDGPVSAKDKKVLVYGGSSSFGSLSVQYVKQAGYTVVTTSSPPHWDFVSKLGAVAVVDHKQEHGALVKALVAEGPYDLIVDSISFPNTVAVTAEVVAAQGGGKLYTLQPAFGPETLPEGVTRVFESWSSTMDNDLRSWAFTTYLPQGLSGGKIIPLPIEKIEGGLDGVSDALDRLQKGVSGVKLIVDPWE
ncbi:alcohol dehydrogenase GroES-like domain-containing protein [Lindgomyces ingoldianus]|uniref:Alcohol dehydrogenase GroES-like domain-containing protein n=1 Tax=Lindgomyces ingoldianus TaxID=673940 RepID=A0ACB6QX05_9PLEO|nr:alcohol dehydrogenase GroES-like domain-containing protein [Lindgomyces ingoldianus]KAF2470817.1 alcohol dehydrogenase GroES-like domain-containing protein [Lindgomyces ingoldianus]